MIDNERDKNVAFKCTKAEEIIECIILKKEKRLPREELNRTSNTTFSVASSPKVFARALPEALDDSEERTGLVLGWVGAENERLGSAEELASPGLALGAFKSEGDLLGLLGLLSEDGLGLTTKSSLLGLITTGTLRDLGVFALLVLGDLVLHVLFARLAERVLRFGSVDLQV